MAKSFKKANPLDNINNGIEDKFEPPKKTEKPKEKRSVGRPKIKSEETKTVNIAIPLSVLEQINIAKLKYGDNLTKYINEIIAKDLETNMETYQQI